jgi:hypothetical protein
LLRFKPSGKASEAERAKEELVRAMKEVLAGDIRVPYSWEGGSGELELGEVPLTLSEGCLPNK